MTRLGELLLPCSQLPERLIGLHRDIRVGQADVAKHKIRERRERYAEKPAELVEILHEGSRRARKIAVETMAEVRAAINLTV